MFEPLVSIVIPLYNKDEWIFQTLDSVYKQTYRNWECIVINDGSTDQSLKQVENFISRYPGNWQNVTIANSGQTVARNLGIQIAKGGLIAFLDADDSWHPKKLELQYSWMNGHPEVLFTAHSSIQISKISSKIKFNNSKNFYPLNVIKFLFFNCIPTRSVMLKRNVRYRFLSGKRYAEDYLLWLQILLNGHRGFYSKSILAFSYKDDFGRAGLSANLWAHQKGELLTYKTIYMQKLISTPFFIVLYLFSLIKFSKRIIVFFISKFSCH